MTTIILVNLVISIAAILVLILRFKVNPTIALFLGALYMGIGSGVGSTGTLGAIGDGFGGLMKGIGLSVGFGIMLGQLLADSGAVQSIANKMLRVMSRERANYALGGTGFIVSTPVFYDVGYVILVPLCRTLAKSAKSLPHFVGALVAGLGIAHTFVPPTPGPMTGGELLQIDLGITMLWGLIIAFPTFMISMWVYEKFFLNRNGFWNPAKDEDESFIESETIQKAKEATFANEDNLPGFWASMLPILMPVILILLGTCAVALLGKKNVPEWIMFISDRNIAMLAGVFAAMNVARRVMTKDDMERSINKALGAAGIVLLITGAGGAFGAVLAKAGVGKVLVEAVKNLHIHPLILTWAMASLFKFAQGSGTVAMITAVSIIAPAVPAMGMPPILVALAAFSGSLFGCHVNDSGFWITAKIAGLSTSGGFKTYSTVTAIQSIISIVLILLVSMVM